MTGSISGGAGNNTLNVTGGAFTDDADGGASSSTLATSVTSPGSLVFSATQHLTSLTFSGLVTMSSNGSNVLVVTNLSFAAGGKLDLTNNTLIDNYTGVSPAPSIRKSLQTGLGSGTWNGTSGITSSSIAGTANSTLGYGEASVVAPSGSLAGQTVDSTTVIIRFTYLGDANLDRTVNIADLGLLATNYGSSNTVFTQGDFNYDGSVNIADLGLLATDYGRTLLF